MDNQTGEYALRPCWYHNIDGVGESGIGFMFMALELLQWFQIHTPENSLWNQQIGLFVYGGLMCLVIHYGTKAIKKRITYPRTGYVEYRKRDTLWRPLFVGMAAGLTISAGMAVALKSGWDLRTALLLFGLAFAGIYGRSFAKAVRWKWTVALIIGAGSVAIALLPAGLVEAAGNGVWIGGKISPALVGACLLSFVFYGATLTVSGVISFCLYLRRTQPPAAEA